MERNNNYQDYLVESVAYSFAGDTGEEEGNEFDMNKIERAKKILSSIGTEDKAFYVDTEIANNYGFTKKKPREKFCIVSQDYLENYDANEDYWYFPLDKNNGYYEIAEIKYVLSSFGREFLEFYIFYHKDSYKSTNTYYTVYDFQTKRFDQYQGVQSGFDKELESGTTKLYNYNNPEFEEAILDVIEMFRR